MKKVTALLFICFALLISACAPLGASAAVEPSAVPGIMNTNYAEALPVPSQLAMGTISLKDTPHAVTASEAAALLPLWKGLLALASTANSSTIEINAVISQIQETMTTEQLQAIAALKLTQADFAKVVQTAGIGGTNGETRPGAGGTQGQGAAGRENRGAAVAAPTVPRAASVNLWDLAARVAWSSRVGLLPPVRPDRARLRMRPRPRSWLANLGRH